MCHPRHAKLHAPIRTNSRRRREEVLQTNFHNLRQFSWLSGDVCLHSYKRGSFVASAEQDQDRQEGRMVR